MRTFRLAAAATAASLPLWPTAAGAAEGPEQYWEKSEDVVIYGDTCHIQARLEYEADFSSADMSLFVSGEGNCQTAQTYITAYVKNLEGDQQTAGAGGAQSVSLHLNQTSRVDTANYDVGFTTLDCTSRDPGCYFSYSVSPK